jgi:ABC-type glutathione transport system ATPase component
MWTMTLYDFQLLIADEPTASLDTTIQKEIVDLLIQRRRNNEISSMLLFTHDLRLVKALLTEEQDRIYFLEPHESGGYGIRQMYTPRELFHSEHEDLSRFVQKKISISRSLGFKREPQSAESSGEVHLEIRNLKQVYKHGIMGKTKTVLHIPDLVIKRGEIVGLVGESGCGKSTFARAVVRLLNHTDSDSEIVFYPIKDHEAGPFDLVQLQPNAYKDNKQMRHLRSRIQIIFQDAATAFNPEMTIEETFNETFRLYRYRDKSRILRNYLQALRLAKTNIEIEKILASYPSEMSAGQRQRLTLIRALLARPEFLILDEPFTNVDRETTQDMLKVIKTIQKDRTMTCIMISHDLSLVMEVCDRVIVMEAGSDGIGREHQSGKPEELFANPRPYTKKLLQSILRV